MARIGARDVSGHAGFVTGGREVYAAPTPMSTARRLRRIARRIADVVPITPLGVLASVVAVVALRQYAYAELDLVLLVAAYSLVAMVALAVVVVGIAGVVLGLRMKAPVRTELLVTETARSTSTGFSVTSLRFFPFLQVDFDWDPVDEAAPRPRVERTPRRGRLWETVTFSSRGEVDGVTRRIVVADAFGLARVAIRKNDPLRVEIVPHLGHLSRLPFLSSFAGGEETPHPLGLDEGDRLELRRYAPGDPARFIHWKVFGRTRKLMVRTPERALARARRTIAYFVAGTNDEASAGAARLAIEGDAFGDDWSFSADGASHDTDKRAEALALLVKSARARSQAGRGLSGFLERQERKGPASVVVFAPAEPGPWIDAVLAAAKRRAHRMRVILAVDGLRSVEATPLRKVARALSRRLPKEEATTRIALEAVLRALGGARCEVIVLDRPSGRRLGSAHLQAPAARQAA